MNRIIRTGVIGLAGLVGVGIASVGAGAATGAVDSKDMYLNKRELSSMVLAVEDDDSDAKDDTNTGTGNQTWSRTGNSNDATGSAHTAVSRDRDRSRGDKTRDWTRDGGDHTRDFSRFLTNDGSRNDTRGRR